nr:MAG TPA: hypothetical protein [Caudoviricetes sp.]
MIHAFVFLDRTDLRQPAVTPPANGHDDYPRRSKPVLQDGKYSTPVHYDSGKR